MNELHRVEGRHRRLGAPFGCCRCDGTLLSISDIAETLEVQSHPLTLELSGANPALVALAMGNTGKGKRVRVWVGVFNAAGDVEGTPSLESDCQLDTMQVIDGIEE